MSQPTAQILCTPDRVIAVVCRVFGVERADLASTRKPKRLVVARHAACLLARKMSGAGVKELGALLGIDHSTVSRAVAKCVQRMEQDERVHFAVLMCAAELEA